jgi:adenylosuccinate lyase
MRRYNIKNPYEQLKALTRGKSLTQTDLAVFIHTLDLPDTVKVELLQLSPATYVGLAEKLAREV